MDRQSWLLKEQNRYCDIIDQLQRDYNEMDNQMNGLHKQIESLNKEIEFLNNEMTNTRNRIVSNEKKICRINKALRDKNPPEIFNPKDYEGDVSNV
jgi:uncharacterized coiled-coil DUF342 family protein